MRSYSLATTPIIVLTLLFLGSLQVHTFPNCTSRDQSSLLQLKRNLVFDPLQSKLIRWKPSSSCCSWLGVTCNTDGHVIHLDLGSSKITGGIVDPMFDLHHLESLDLSKNNFNGTQIPSGIRKLTNLLYLYLAFSGFGGPLNISTIPPSLVVLDLSRNNFSGTIDIVNMLRDLRSLIYIDLSFNALSVVENDVPTYSPPPRLEGVFLASCNVKGTFPFFLGHHRLKYLDLSDNLLVGEIPIWVWQPELVSLDLSLNSLTGFQGSLPDLTSYDELLVLDLSSNLLRGQIPLPPPNIYFLDYSSNNFDSIPSRFGDYIPYTKYLYMSFSNNDLKGNIPLSLCHINTSNTKDVYIVIDLSLNSLSGTIPHCLVGMNLKVLNLKGNRLDGNIPDAFREGCFLRTIDLSGNQLQGTVPESMANCEGIQVVNLGSNQLSGGFPCWLMQLSDLHVLVLRSNKFLGHITCAPGNATSSSMLQIIDIAANDFSGELPYKSFKTWTSMKIRTVMHDLDYLKVGSFYEDTLVITSKGASRELVKILKVLNVIDFSCNHFEGSIPWSVGDLKALFALNMSHNRLKGEIPSSLGNFKEMESLDLAYNQLTGVIPEQITSLNFLAYLNLSYNQLEGRIPTSTQLQSFSEWSYIGNKGLYGPPLGTNCANTCEQDEPTTADVDANEVLWQFVCVEIGYVVGLGAVIVFLVLHSRWRRRYFEYVDRLIFRIFPQLDPQGRVHAKRRNQKRGRQ